MAGSSLAARWNRFWFEPTPLARLALFRVAVCALALADVLGYARIALADAAAVSAGEAVRHWSPIYAFHALGVEPLALPAAKAVLSVAVVALSAALVGLFTRVSMLAGALTTLYWIGSVYSFGKVHHDKVAFAFALLALAVSPCGARWSLDAWLARRRGREPARASEFAGTPLRFVQVTIAIGYCASGLSKLAIGGLEWLNGYTLMSIVMSYDNVAARWLCSNLVLLRVASALTIALQALFPLVFVFPRTRWFFLPSAVAFHVGTWWTMDTGPYMSLWLLLIAFLPLERLPGAIADAWRVGERRTAVLRAVVAFAALVLVLRVLAYSLPPWVVLAGIAPLAWLVIAVLRDEREHARVS